LERTNVRDLTPEMLPWPIDVVTADLSFIALAAVVPALVRCAASSADLVLLVKPQFESGRESVGRGGVVRDPAARAAAVRRVARALTAAGAGPLAVTPSPLRGPAGNVEFLLHARAGAPGTLTDEEIDAGVGGVGARST
ncbi:MAG TPA: SAM-dependent methyltransferase, partial [Actinomycetota bacterium]|nr:SAM-dependent methyltransferase [Actinomycetota bacterium]